MAAPDSKLLMALISRLNDMLPIKSGVPLNYLEQDPIFNQNVAVIVKLSLHRLNEVASALSGLLETISRSSGFTSDEYSSSTDNQILVHQSQLFVLRLMGNCMAYFWKCYRENVLKGITGENASATLGRNTLGKLGNECSVSIAKVNLQKLSVQQGPLTGSPQSAVPGNFPPPVGSTAAPPTSSQQAFSAAAAAQFYVQNPNVRPMIDPPPLDENLSKFILSLLLRCFFTSSQLVNPDTINHSFALCPPSTTLGNMGGSMDRNGGRNLYATTSNIGAGSNAADLPPNSPVTFGSPLEAHTAIQVAAGRILFFLSASNWNVVYSHLRKRFIYLAQIGNNPVAAAAAAAAMGGIEEYTPAVNMSAETGDLTEFRMLEWCNLNRQRLSTILADLNSYFRLIPKRAQLLSSVVLRRAIWNWIEAYPMEFVENCRGTKKVEGSPDSLFDTLNSMADNTRRRIVYWPTMTLLLILCPDILYAIGMSGAPGSNQSKAIQASAQGSSVAKKAAFLDQLRKYMRPSGGVAGVAVFCYVELCRASTFVNKTDGSALRMIVPNIENELKEKLFDPHRGSMDKDAKVAEDFLLDRRIMTECVVALFKLNPWNTLRSLVPVLLDHNAPIVFNVVFVKACFMIVNESYPLPWNPNIDASLASPLRQLFNEFLYREKHLDNRSKNSWGAANVLGRVEKRFRKAVLDDLMENRTEILASTLKTWSRCPLLVMAKDATIIPPEELRALLIGIASCLREHNSTIRTMAAETLLQIFDPDFVGHWDGSRQDWRTHDEIAGGEPGPAAPPPTTPRHDATALRTYWRVSSQVFSSISKQLLEVRADQLDFSERGPSALQITKALLNLLRDLLMRRNEFLRRVLSERIAEAAVANGNTAGGPTNVPVPGTATNERFQASVALENALFVALCSADPEISPTAGMCFALLVDEAELTGESAIARAGSGAIPSLTIVENLQCFKDMKALFEEVRAGGVVLGQKALQKRIRKILRNAVNPTAGNMGAWEEIYRRWRGLTQLTTMRMGSTVSTVEAFRSGIGVINYGDDEELTGNNLDPEILDPRTSKFKNKEPKEDSRATTSMATTSMLGTSAPSSSVLSGTTVDFYEDRGEWSNYTGFLSAMGAVCAQTMSSTRYGDPTQKPSNDALAIVEGLADPVADQQNGFTGQQSMGSMSRRQSAHGAQPIGQQPLQYPSSNGSNPDVSAAAAQGMSGQMVAFQMANAFSNARGLAERFVSEMVELLVCDNVMVREAAKDFLGNELATSLYGILFKTLEALVERFFDGKNEVMITERNTVLLESTIAVLKLTIDRAEELSPESAKMYSQQQFHYHQLDHHMAAFDFGSVILTFVQYVNRIGSVMSSQAPIAMRIRIRLCQLIEVLIARREHVSLRQEVPLRNKLVETMLEWNSEFHNMSRKVGGQIQMIAVNANQAKLQTDLDVAAMKAMVTVLSGLPLQPTAEGPTAKTAYDEQIMRTTTMKLDEESSDAKSRLFYKYFSFCLKVLQKCKFLEVVGAAGSQELLWLQGILSHSKEHMQHLQQLKEYTVLAISNLLSANIDIGLRFSLGMGYHEDVKTRSAFMQVLTNILNMGAAAHALGPGTPGSQENVKNAVPNTNGNLTIAMALCETAPVAEVEEVSQVLLNVFESRGLVLRLLKTAVEREVMSTDTSSNLFRRNSMATRLLTMFARTHGQSFLFASLRPILKDIVSRHPPLTFELDPNKLVSTDDRATNLRNLAYASQAFLNAIFANAPNVPPALRAICSMVYATVMQKFPSEGESRAVTGVGGFFFLRFVCPAIVGPESHDLVVQPIVSKDLRRGLVLITKVIQNLANDVLFGVKESFMADLNPLLQDNIGHVHGFLKEISVSLLRPVDIDEATMAKRPLEEMDILRLHKHLANNLDKIERLPAATIGTLYQPAILESGKGANSRPVARSTAAAKQIIASVSTLLAQLGAVPDVPRLETRGGSSMGGVQSDFGNGRLGVGPAMTKQHILEFMIRVESRPGLNKALEVLRERKVFYEGPPSKERHPVFYYIARRFVNETIDMELFLYFLLITLRSVVNRQWEFVVDVTKYTAENEWGLEWLSRLEKLLPQEIIMNIHTTYMYNVNSALRKGFKKNRAGQFLRPLMKRIIMIGSISEFAEYIPATDLRLPRSTVAIEKEINSSYQPVYKSIPGGYKVTIPVVIKISQEHIQVTTAKKQDYGGINAFVNDVYHISDVEDVVTWSSSKSNGDDGGEFQIQSTTPPDTSGNSNTITVLTAMTFASPKRELILQGIRAAKARYQLSRGVGPQYLNAGRRELRPNDVPGTLLNMGLLNIGSDDANLRWSSYNLLYSLSKSFNFDIGNELLVAKGLCIPINNQGFVLAISKRLAASEPNLTLEFLIECGHGFQRSNKELKHYCLEYMAPWLPNLAHYWKASSHAREGSGEIPLPGAQAAETQMAKMNEVLKMLIDMTVNESEMNPLIQSKIWMAIGEVDLMLPFIIDHFVKVAVHHRLGSVQCEVLANTLITLASVNLHIVSGKIIARLRKVISRTSIQQTATLVDHSSWPEISVLARFLLMLSFNNRLDVHQFLPELFHIVNLLVGVGAPIIRSAIHGIVVNIVQSLATSPELDDVGVRTLQLILTELSEPKFSLLFGLKPSSSVTVSSGGANAAFNFSADVLSGDGWRDVPLSSLENIINIMLDVMTFGAPDPEIGATWKSRWMSLVASTAFQFNPAIQPRAFIALGCLARDDADDDLLYQILVTLRGALSLFEENESNLIVSILTALCNIVGGLAPDSRYLKSLFWLAVGLAQIGHIPIFNTAVQLLQVVLRTLDSQGAFTAETLVSGVLLSAREPIADVASLLDNSTGITFRTDFSFALSATLLKGLKNPTTKTATISALMTVLEICAKHEHYSEQAISNGIAGDVQAPVNKVSPYILGYILPLIPFTEKLSNLFWVAGVEPNDEDDLDDFNQTDDIYPTNGRITSAYHFNVGIGSMGGVTPAPDVGMFGIGGPVALPSQQLRMYRRLFSQFDLTALPYLTSLSCALMVTMLENSDNDNESLFMYAFLAEASTNHPDDFSLV
ncbi:hypothetical protein BJ742DRAFT_685193 [Cladochytrium replicatum]|nr:hypothetical protein BJ742DRAFT_685193 [Cladochytrium replicatum]